MAAEDINNTPDSGAQEAAPVNESAPAAEPVAQETAQPAESSQAPGLTQADVNRMVQQAQASDPRFQKLEQLEQLFSPQQEEVNPFTGELGFEQFPEAAQYLNNNQNVHNQQLQEQAEQIAYLKQREAQRDFESAMNNFTTYWEEKYTEEQSLVNAINESLPYLAPDLQQQYQAAVNGDGYLDANFMANLDQAMKNKWISQLDDPNSGALDALLKEAAKKKALQDRSMLSSNTQTTDTGKKQDKFSSRLIILDDE